MKALRIAATSIRRMLREPSNVFFVFIFPMLLIIVLGSAFGGGFRPRLGVFQDGTGTYSDALVQRLSSDDSIEIDTVRSLATLEDQVERGRFEAGVMIPAGYDDALAAGQPAELTFIGSNGLTSQQLRSMIEAAFAEDNIALRTAVVLGGDISAGVAEAQAVRSTAGDVRVDVTSTGEAVFPETLGQFDVGAPQQLLLFVFLTSLAGSVALIQSRRWGVTRRMVSTPTTTGTIVLGEGLGRFGVAMVQGLFIMIGSLIMFAVNWGSPLGAGAVLILFCAVGAGAGMLAGSTFANDQQAGSFGIFASLGLGALGGCMMPLDFFSGPMRTVAHFTPHAWGLDAFTELIRHDGTIVDILPELGVLAGFAVVLLGLASWQLRRTLTA